ncbi:site-specific integrase [Planomicrobium sp. MB-3u-38]|uniref:tyrosine-type recombinase/integrase n=1 Tax=Planomicrobium sp. MB-3u-38 TaxID=2058318 RepID=UPI000C79DFC6|nr:site-specific integrase [Planomicrobium sp. MB-3u-38]PKH11468.1 integrase [Planomicrobium sp. MB-3u-38]
MSKRSGVFDVQVDVSKLIRGEHLQQPKSNFMTLEKAMVVITKQMQVSGFRERTMKDYLLHWNHFAKITGTTYLSEITVDTIYAWLGSMVVSNQTKLTRLKCLKAILTKCFDNGWLEQKFWKTINIKVDKNVKKGSASGDIELLLSLLNLNSFVGLRDAVAIITLHRTGIRINTLGQLEERHIDFENLTLSLDGSILKNHKMLQLPIDEQTAELLRVLIQQNKKIRKRYSKKNSFVFITQKGDSLDTKSTNNAISKRLNKYSKEFGLKDINPHAIRRAYAKNLLNKGADVALISKALGHSNLAVTTRYLDLDIEEVATSLRDFL